jgi:pyridoxamine 5'-phosphate oxidase
MVRYKSLSKKSVEKDPFVQFEKWYSERLVSGISKPNAFSLATSTSKGDVSSRTVLLKEYSRAGFVFFTNYSSKKGKQMSENKKTAMLFYWPEKGRQVRVEGTVEKISPEESLIYFSSRPRESRIGAWASEQSSTITDREYLDKRFSGFIEKFKGKAVPLPPHWGGFRIIPSWFEFWQEGRHRLHDRITYQSPGRGWIISRLAP